MEAPARRPAAERLLVAAVAAVAAVHGIAGLAAMLWLAPRVPYADGWRFLGHFIERPFPWNVLAADNGHREVLPNLVRVLELHLFASSQWLQIVAGALLAVAALALGLWVVRRDRPHPLVLAASGTCLVLSLFWLGNIRALAHGNESVHAYLIILFLVGGVALILRMRQGDRHVPALVGLLGVGATLSFGSGIACFAAFAFALLVRRATLRQWSLLAVAVLLAAAAVLAPADRGSGLAVAPVMQADLLLRWLAAPSVYAVWPALDPDIAQRLPVQGLRAVVVPVAAASEGLFGPVMTARWPHLLVGALGLVWLALETRAALVRPARAGQVLGGALAWFVLAVGGLVALARLAYFQDHPEQLLAPRYVVWSSLFWAGLGLSAVARTRHPARAAGVVLLVGVALVPSIGWMAALGASQRAAAERTAVAAAVGVIEPDLALGENVVGELSRALPSLRAAGVAVFAWPETQVQDTVVERLPIAAADIRITPVANLIGAEGSRVSFVLEAPIQHRRLLLVDERGIARGMAIREREGWVGWVRGRPQRVEVVPPA